ncbi:hypothetical protein [Thalassiella azotivora]
MEATRGRHDAFRQLVADATALRLEGNREALAAWRSYVRDQLSPRQLEDQVAVERERSLIATAASGPRPGVALPALERRSRQTSWALRGVEERVAENLIGGGCQYCHEVQRAISFEYDHPELSQPTSTPGEMLERVLAAERTDPTPLPDFLDAAPSTGLDPAALTGYPGVSAQAAAVEAVRPVLRQLGDDGFKVLGPEITRGRLSGPELLAAVEGAIETRRTNFALLAARTRLPGFDYLLPRPVLRELLPLAGPDVRRMVQDDLTRAAEDAEAESLVVGVASVGALLLTIFPPTSALGLALDVGLAAYGVAQGFEAYEQGATLSLGVGSTVLDPAQQEAAHGLMAMGALNVVLSAVGGTVSGLQAVRMVRVGRGADAVLEAVEARTSAQRITVSDLNTSRPRATVTDADGDVVLTGYLDELALGGPGGAPRAAGGGGGGGGGGPAAPGGGAAGGVPGRVPDLLDLQQASALRQQAGRLQARAAQYEADAVDAVLRGRPDRAMTFRRLAEEADELARARSALAEEYRSGRRSARAELPGPEDLDRLWEGAEGSLGPAASSGNLARIPLSAAERDPSALVRLSRELMTSSSGNRVVYRVDGGGSRALLTVDGAGNVSVAHGRTIDLNFGSPERAYEFLSKPTKGGEGARLVRFEVSEEWVRSLRSGAVPEGAGRLGRTHPQLVDVKYADDQIKVPGSLTHELEDFIIPGSGREVVVDSLKPGQ